MQNQHIKEILDKIASINPKAFEDFSSSYPSCLLPKKKQLAISHVVRLLCQYNS